MVRHENPLQSRRAQGYVIAHAYRSELVSPRRPGPCPETCLPRRVRRACGSGALCPPSAPAGVQLTVGVASRLWRTGHAESAGPAGPPASGLPALPPLAVCAYGCPKTWLWWFAEPALQALPPPADGLLSRVGDRTLTGTRGSKHPVAHKTRLSQYQPDVFGFRIVSSGPVGGLLASRWMSP